jgi:hypothetical protein
MKIPWLLYLPFAFPFIVHLVAKVGRVKDWHWEDGLFYWVTLPPIYYCALAILA